MASPHEAAADPTIAPQKLGDPGIDADVRVSAARVLLILAKR